MKRYWSTFKPYFAALLIFLSSRVVMALAILFSSRFVPQAKGEGLWTVNAWYRYLLRFDSAYYLWIVHEGYSYNGNDTVKQPVVFYPLYPLLARAAKPLFHVHDASLLIVSNLSILIAIPLAFKLFKSAYGDEAALYAIGLLSFFPTALFFSVGYTESLVLLLIVVFFLLLRAERYFPAAACAGLASATRSTGLVLMLPLACELWRKFSKDYRRLFLYESICLALASSGLVLYMLYLWSSFHNPLAFITATRAWNPSTPNRLGYLGGGDFFQELTLQPFKHLLDVWEEGATPAALSPWFFLSFLLLTLCFRKRLPVSFTLYALGVLFLPYFTVAASLGFLSFTRYILLAFPVFIVLGQLCKTSRWLGLSMTGLFAAMLFMYTALFAQWYWAG